MRFCTCLSPEPVKFSAYPFKGDFVENVEAIKKLGFDGIELIVRDPATLDQNTIIETVRSAGMDIPAIGTGLAWGEEGLSFTDPNPAVRSKAVERIYSHVPLAEKAGAVIVIGLVRGIVRPEVDKKDAEEWMFDGFSRCCRRAAESGVRIAFEPINRYETSLLNGVQEGLEFIREVGGDNLGMLLDTFHMNIEEPSIEESIRAAGDRIFHFHYSDSNRWYPGAGHLDFKSILTALKKTGYSGYLSGEHRPDPEPAEAARLGLANMKTILGELQ
jgi:sugar phosphate isomerase/epimerase